MAASASGTPASVRGSAARRNQPARAPAGRVGDDWAGFEAKWKELYKKNLRLVDIETWLDGKTRRYAGLFHAGTYEQALWVGDDWFGFEQQWKAQAKKGRRLVDIEVYGSEVD